MKNSDTVKITGGSFFVNSNKSVPNDPRNTDYQAVQRWLLGKTDEWLELERIFNEETAMYNKWLEIPNNPEPEPTITPLPPLVTNVPEDEFTQAELDAQFNADIDTQLIQKDTESIRSLREYIASLPQGPQNIKDMENEVAALRSTKRPV